MSQTVPQPVQYLADYRPWPFTLSETQLDVTLAPRDTRVLAQLRLTPQQVGADLVLDGGTELRLISLTVDGRQPEPAHIIRDGERLQVEVELGVRPPR